MRSLSRAAATALLLLVALCLTAPPAKAQATGNDLTVMQALAALPNWSQALGWPQNTNPCPQVGTNWPGVSCINGRVTVIIANCSSTLINGTLPGTLLGQLTALTDLQIRNCGLWGPIPDAMQTLTQLGQLRLDVNSLSGPLPPWLATLPGLSNLQMGGNRFTGSVPAFPNSTGLFDGLDVNFLSGDIPVSWTKTNISLTYNLFNIPFPASCNRCSPNRLASLPTVTVTKVSGDGQWTQAGSAFANPLSVVVTDLSNNPVAGATVTFSGPGINTATAVTDNNGLASATVSASSTVGGNTVTAAVGLTGMTTFGLTAGDVAACLGNIQVTSNGDTGSGTLREALADVCPGGTVDLTPIASQTIALSAGATSYNFSGRLYIGDDVTIAGHGVTISGSGNTRIFFIQGGNVSMTNLTLTNGLGQGGSSQYGGPGAGMGGAIFQNGGALTLTGVVFSNNTAQGGTTDSLGSYTGGGFGANSAGGDLGGANGAGDGAGGVEDGAGDPGGFGGGGGYGTAVVTPVGGSSGTYGGVGGFGASVGNSVSAPKPTNPAQIVTIVNSIVGNGYGAAQGGGAGFGGAIFTRAGTLNLIGDTFTGNSAVGASGAQGKGGSVFIYDTASYNVDAATTFSASVAAAAGAPGIGYSPTISGDLTYEAGNTCPGADTTDLCGVVSNYALTGPASAAYQSTFQVTPASNNSATPTLSVLSGPCSLFGTTFRATAASGVCVVAASWAANGIYPASTATATVNITPASPAGACVAPPSSLTAWYKAENNTNDVTGAYNGTAGGDVGYASGEVGQAFSFDGTQSPSVSLPAAAFATAQTAISFEAWFRTNGETGGVILGHQNQAAYGSPSSATAAIYVGTNGRLYVQQAVSSYAVNDSQWHHVAVTFDGTNQIAYLDGVAFGSPQAIASGAWMDAYYQLGTGYTNGGWYTFNGRIDEATIYSAVLQPADILNIISAGTYGKCNTSMIYSGNGQTGVTTRTLPQPFIISTTNSPSSVTFTIVPNGGAGGTWTPINGFPTPVINGTVAQMTPDLQGFATSPQLTANATPGSFTVTANDGVNTAVFQVTTTACAATPSVTLLTDTGVAGELRYAMNNACAGSTIDLTALSGTITLGSRIRIEDSLTISGPGASTLNINGNTATRLFFIGSNSNASISISNLTLENGLGAGGSSSGGGGGAGMGGAIFQDGGMLALTNVTLSGNKALGGGSGPSSNPAGGGGFGGSASGNAGAGGGDLFGIGGIGSGASGGDGAGGGFGAGGNGGAAGAGGFGGGGGFGASRGNGSVFGGGGGGGGEGDGAGGGFGGGGGGTHATGGGGGAGFGGAIFERNGVLTLSSVNFTGNSANAGNTVYAGNGPQNGQAKGGALFIYSGATATVSNITFTGDIAADAGKPGIGNSAAPYSGGATCPGQDTVDVCGLTTVTVTVGTNVPGLSFSVDSVPYTVAQTFNWTAGQQHTLTIASLQAGTVGTQYAFTSWSDGTSTLSDTITVSAATGSYKANFQTQYLVTVKASPSAGGTVTGGGYFNAGSTPAITATPNANYQFSNWTGTVASASSANTSLTALTAPQTVTANFALQTFTATVGTNQPGTSFSVDGTTFTSTQQFTWAINSQHAIATTATQPGTTGTQYVFSGWSDSGALSHIVTFTGTTTYTASFQTQYLLTINASPSAGGTVTGGGYFDAGSTPAITATPNANYQFSSWTGTVASASSANTSLTALTAPQTVTANFTLQTFTATVGTNQPGTSFSVDGTTYTSTQQFTWAINSQHTIATTATQPGTTGTQYVFSGWSDSGALSHIVTFTGTTTYTASFQTQYLLTINASPSAGGTVTASGYFNAGSTPAITATPNAGYVFGSWSGPAISSGAQSSVLMNAPKSVTANFLRTQTITFTSIPTQVVGTPLTLTATATSSLPVSYQSTTQTVCTVSGSTVSFLAPGLCSITASQVGNNTYSAAQSITQMFTVNPNVPTISNLQAVSVGGNSEVITWNTDQPSTTQVNYGPTSTYTSSSPLDNNLVTFHSVTLTNLSQNTTYNFDVSSTNSTSGTATSTNSTFTTTPFVGYVAFWGVNNSGVTISWSTDLAATTFVAYGTTTSLGQTTPVQSALTNSHGVVLTGLNPGTTYYFRAESTTAGGSTGASAIYNFTTTGEPASPAPVISNVTMSNITTTSATISWTTDQAATTQVNYGTTTAYGSSSPLYSILVTSHSVTLTGLTPGTTYDYDVISTNASGTSSGMSTNYTFATKAVVATPPVISNIQTTVTSTTATITWTTDQNANSAVIYGAVSTTPDNNYVMSHSVTLTGLTPGTTYNFSVVSTNAAALSTTSPTSNFTTTASNATPPYVGYLAFWGINNSGVTISWSTDVPANTQLAYGTTPALGQLTPVQSALTNSHGVVLTGLASGTTYYFVAQSTGTNGATGYSTTYSFTTTGSPSAPAPVISNIQASVTNTTAIITWTTDEAGTSQVNYGVTTTYSASSTLNPTLTTTHSVTLTNLMPGTTYNFDVVSSNVNNLSTTSTNSTFQTTGSAPGPVISKVAASSITSSTALITWTTDQASTSVVNYGNQTVSDPTLVTSHSLTLSGLTPNTSYTFSVTSVNAGSVSTTSSTYNFTTSTQSASAPVISYVAFWGVTNSGVTISWSTNVPSNTSVAYGTSTSALTSVTPVQPALTDSHGVTLTGLQPSTTYYFQAQSADVNGNTGYSATIYTFTTLAGGMPVISNVVPAPASGNTATISWKTSVPTYSYVQYGSSSGNYGRYSAQTSLTTTPTCTLGYVPSGTVYYQLVSTDASGNQVVSPEAMFVEP